MAKYKTLHCEAWRAGQWWVAQALEVAIVGQGESLESAKQDLEEAIRMYVEDVRALIRTGQKVDLIPPVPAYRIRLFWWHIGYFWQQIRARRVMTRATVFTTESELPAHA